MTAPPHSRPADAQGAAAVLGAALALAVAGDLLFRHSRPGLNVLVWVAGLAAWATFLSSRHAFGRTAPDAWQLPAVLLAAAFALRTSPRLLVLDSLALVVALAIPLLRTRGVALARASVTSFAAASLALVNHALLGCALFMLKDLPWREWSRRHVARRGAPVLAGVALAIPLVLLFGALFAAADPVFEGLARGLVAVDLEAARSHVVLAALCGALAAGYLRARLWGERARGDAAPASPAVAVVPVAIATGAMALVFLLFVVVQLRYLFGGAAFVRAAVDLSLAEYARRGFFESVAACGLSLPILLLGDWAVDTRDARGGRSFRALCVLQVALIGVVLVSALERLRLYVAAFGLTVDRVYVAAGLLWLASVGAWFLATVMRGRRDRFAFGALVSGFAVLAALNVASPDALAVRVNVARAAAVGGRGLDTEYFARLSLDAAPAITAGLALVPDDAVCGVLEPLVERLAVGEATDWRGWNLARVRARAALQRALQAHPECAVIARPAVQPR